MIEKRDPRRTTPLSIASATIAPTKLPSGAVAAPRSSASIACLIVHGMASEQIVPPTRQA